MAAKDEHIRELLRTIPDTPGIYQYFDQEGTILYVGKAKNLRKRVSSYFNRDTHENRKTTLLVRQVADIRYLVVNSELDALLLENSLIKKYQPKYNIQLKDDKTYPWIAIKNERFPRVFHTRQLVKDGSSYYGPYASVKIMHAVLDMIREMYPLRTCSYNLSEENIARHKFKVCLEFHIGNCKGPCAGHQTEQEYNGQINHIREILRGNIQAVLKMLRDQMQELSEKFEFEKAQQVKTRIDHLEAFRKRSTVVSPVINDVDVFSIHTDEDAAYVNYFKVMNGAIVQGHTIELRKRLDEPEEDLLLYGITELRTRFESRSPEIILPFELALPWPEVKVVVPQRGDKKKLLELSQRNVSYFRQEKRKQTELVDPERHTKRIMERMMKDLRLTEEPRHIECFDNSNFHGSYPVAAMTVFKNGKPSKRDYRHFNIKTVEGPDDFASMEEVIYRRYKRALDEDQPLPQLIVIDGGKGQLGAALKSLEKLGLRGKLGIIGIAKKLEEIYYPGDPVPLYLDKKGETLKVIQHIRDEAHRFGITHHRGKRAKGTLRTELNEIEGVSTMTSRKLLTVFHSVKQVKEAGLEDLEKAVGKAKAKLVFEHFQRLKGSPPNGNND